jgi:hypothetical protein
VSLNWKSVSAEHVRAAIAQAAASRTHRRATGLVLLDGDRALPAKDILRTAYCLANKLSSESDIKFSSGDGTLNILRRLGFKAERRETPTKTTV